MYSFTVSLTDNCDDNKDADHNDADNKSDDNEDADYKDDQDGYDYIKCAGGVADRHGGLKRGDQLLSVNGVSFLMLIMLWDVHNAL